MKITDLGLGDYDLEVTGEDLALTDEEVRKENERLVREIDESQKNLETVSETTLVVDTVVEDEEKLSKSLDLLEKEKKMQDERYEEWKKEKKSKRTKRVVKTCIWVFVVGVLGLAWIAGYRIPIPDEWVRWADGAWNAARDFVIGLVTR